MAYKRRLRFDKRIKFQKKMNIIYILLLVVLASIGTGYAYIKSDLNINGTANVTRASWDVHFENLNVTTGSVTASTPATIVDDTEIEFAVTLEEPGDYYEFLVDVVNEGTIDAMIGSVNINPTLTPAQHNYLRYSVTTDDGLPLNQNQILSAGSTEKVKVVFSYYEAALVEDYPTEDQTFNISVSIDYVQADSSAIETRSYIYGVYFSSVYMGDSVSSLGTTYSSYQDAIDNTGVNVFLRYRASNNLIGRASVGFVYNNNVYYLIGGNTNTDVGPAFYDSESIYFEQNKQLLLNVFGSSNCTVTSYDIECMNSEFSAYAESYGYVRVGLNDSNDPPTCVIQSLNQSYCDGCFGVC